MRGLSKVSRSNRILRRIAAACLLLLGAIVLFAGVSAANDQPTDIRRGRIRAALLYYIAKFIEPGSNTPSNSPLPICIAGDDPLKPYFRSTVKGKSVNGRDVIVTLFDDLPWDSLSSSCEIAFVGQELAAENEPGLAELSRSGVLTVCATPEIRWGHCIIYLFEQENKARVAVDRALADSAGFRLSSELLGLARIRQQE